MIENYSKVMYSIKRTVQHIHRVQNNMVLLTTQYSDKLLMTIEDCRVCMHKVMIHDQSKFGTVQFLPYAELTEYYRQRKTLGNKDYQYPEGVDSQVNDAVKDHYAQENHHLEYDRRFSRFDVYEIACDLQAMAEEYDEGTCRKFYEDVWKPKYKGIDNMRRSMEEINMWMNATIECFEDYQSLNSNKLT